MGDVYESFRVVGTTPDMFDKLEYGQEQKFEFAAGREFQAGRIFSAVIGARVARETAPESRRRVPSDPRRRRSHDKHDPFKSSACCAQPARRSIAPCSSTWKAFF
jgi:hypothetical protein